MNMNTQTHNCDLDNDIEGNKAAVIENNKNDLEVGWYSLEQNIWLKF